MTSSYHCGYKQVGNQATRKKVTKTTKIKKRVSIIHETKMKKTCLGILKAHVLITKGEKSEVDRLTMVRGDVRKRTGSMGRVSGRPPARATTCVHYRTSQVVKIDKVPLFRRVRNALNSRF